VIAHELSHIKHRDMLSGTIVAVLAGTIMFLADQMKWAMIFGGGARRDDDRDSGGLGLLFVMIVAPLAAFIIQMAVSRSREYAADEAPAPRALSEEEIFARKSVDELNAERPLSDVFFDLDKSEIRDDARTSLQKDADWLKRWTSTQITLEGHCDSRGSAEYNLGLGSRRATAVKDYLVNLGVPTGRLTVVSKGKEQPFCHDESLLRLRFEEILGELVGYTVSLDGHDESVRLSAERQVNVIFTSSLSPSQTFDLFSSILVVYGVRPATQGFFDRYLGSGVFSSLESFETAVLRYQEEAVRLFSTLREAYARLNAGMGFDVILAPLQKNDLSTFHHGSIRLRYAAYTGWKTNSHLGCPSENSSTSVQRCVTRLSSTA
jgi:hypothetical protein